ncbi:MAG: hypothetical protein P8Y42_16670 [Exilibacterium sp.]
MKKIVKKFFCKISMITFLVASHVVYACGCPSVSFDENILRSKYIFIITIKEVKQKESILKEDNEYIQLEYKYKIDETFKGNPEEITTIHSTILYTKYDADIIENSSCANEGYLPGTHILVFSSKNGAVKIGGCSASTVWVADMEKLNKLRNI